jgi:hypothetical protein
MLTPGNSSSSSSSSSEVFSESESVLTLLGDASPETAALLEAFGGIFEQGLSISI